MVSKCLVGIVPHMFVSLISLRVFGTVCALGHSFACL